MIQPDRLQLSRARGFRLPENAVSVARPGRWGNPYRVGVFGLPLAVQLFRNSMEGFWSPGLVAHLSDELAAEAYRCHSDLRNRVRKLDVRELRGKALACWCPVPAAGEPDLCHRAVLLDLANRPD